MNDFFSFHVDQTWLGLHPTVKDAGKEEEEAERTYHKFDSFRAVCHLLRLLSFVYYLFTNVSVTTVEGMVVDICAQYRDVYKDVHDTTVVLKSHEIEIILFKNQIKSLEYRVLRHSRRAHISILHALRYAITRLLYLTVFSLVLCHVKI